MAGETVLITKDKYQRLLKQSEMYNKMKTHSPRTHEDVLEEAEEQESTNPGKSASNVEDALHKFSSAKDDVTIQSKEDEARDLESEDSENEETFPSSTKKKKSSAGLGLPGIPVRLFKKSLNKIKNSKKNKRLSKSVKVKKSKDWLSW